MAGGQRLVALSIISGEVCQNMLNKALIVIVSEACLSAAVVLTRTIVVDDIDILPVLRCIAVQTVKRKLVYSYAGYNIHRQI